MPPPAGHTAVWPSTNFGGILTADAARPELVRIECDGQVSWRMEVPVIEPHDLVLDDEGIWNRRLRRQGSTDFLGTYEDWAPSHPVRGQALRIARNGQVLDRLPPPPALGDGPFSPTSIAVDSASSGGGGTVWVADGYGQSLVHRYDREGLYLGVIDGTEGAGRFDTPHGLLIDRRRDPVRLLISDRGNGRICTYTMSGQFLGTIGSGILLRPCGMALSGDVLLVADLDGCVWDPRLPTTVCSPASGTRPPNIRKAGPTRRSLMAVTSRQPMHRGCSRAPTMSLLAATERSWSVSG